MRKPLWFLSLVGLVLGAGFLSAAAQTRWHVQGTFHPGREGGWDYVTVDAPRHRLFVTRSTHTLAIDTRTDAILADIPGQIRSHGVALVPKLNRGFITDGGGKGAIVVFDMKTYRVLGSIRTMPDSDGVIYDAAMDRIVAVSGDGGVLMTLNPGVNPMNGRIDPPIDLGGKPEFLASDARGTVYVNLTNKNLVAVVDLKTRRVVARWPVAPGGVPVGMAIDRAHHLLFIGCRDPQKLIVMSTKNGKVVAALPIGSGNDAVRYFDGQAFASCRDGSLTIAGRREGHFYIEQTVRTAEGARTMGLDRITRQIFLPTAQFEPTTKGSRPRMKPNSFEIVVVKAAK